MLYICKTKDKDMRTYGINDSWSEHTIVYFINNLRDIATQVSINKRLNSDKKYGITQSGRGYWSIETNEEIKQRLEKQYFKPIIFD